jgi:4-oxalocrotonate tautomerase
MPIIEVKLWAGPDDETVGRIIQRQTEAICEALGCPPETVTVIVHQIPKNYFGVAGKQRSPEYDERP